ncbi:hypothetical protein [Streptomyces sp. NPDC014733]|uniref:hypothetical protein n=1 Tax=Streptomyces sp. NPDC014733 TaxID=3364885 RepID=UPI0036FB766C
MSVNARILAAAATLALAGIAFTTAATTAAGAPAHSRVVATVDSTDDSLIWG